MEQRSGSLCAEDVDIAVRELTGYQTDLLKAGYGVEFDPDDDQVLFVRDGSLILSGLLRV